MIGHANDQKPDGENRLRLKPMIDSMGLGVP